MELEADKTTLLHKSDCSVPLFIKAAFVLAHEMAHHHLDHHAEGISLIMVEEALT